MPDPIISVKDFSKHFGSTEVISDLSFEVEKGEIFAFLGPNGSGKTTTLRTLLNIYQPTTGTLLINGKRFSQAESGILGYLPEERGLYVTSKTLEMMIYFGQLKGLTTAAAKKFSLDYLKRVDLADKADVVISKLSSGQQQKIQLGITIINNPQLLILDEPTKGLDPLNRELLMDILLDLNRQGTTIIFSTHQMNEAEKIAHRLLMIKDGKRALYGTVDEVKRSFGTNIIHLDYAGKFKIEPALFTAEVQPNTAEITPVKGITASEVLQHLLTQGIEIHRFEVAAPSLDEIFIQVSKGTK